MHKRTGWYFLALVVLLVDQFTKVYFDSAFRYGEVREVIPGFFNWVLVYNPGAAFSFLSDAGGWQRYFFSLLALAVTVWLGGLIWRGRQSQLMNCAASLIIGGALGNLIDRLAYGHVVDFIQLYYDRFVWPAFNLADSAICLGAALMVIDGFRKEKRR